MTLGVSLSASLTDADGHRIIKRQCRKIYLCFWDKTPIPILTAFITLPESHFVPVALNAANSRKAIVVWILPIVRTTHRALSHWARVQPRSRATRSHHASSIAADCLQIGTTGRAGRAGNTGGVNERVFFWNPLRAHFPISPLLPTMRAASSNLCCRAFSLQAGEQRFALYHCIASIASDSDRPRLKHSHATRSVALCPPFPLTAGGSLFK